MMDVQRQILVKNSSSLSEFKGGRDAESKELYKLFLKQIAYRTIIEY